MKGSDMRSGIKKAAKGSTLKGFSPNVFQAGGAQEQGDVSAMDSGNHGPKLKGSPRAERVDDVTDSKELKGNYAG